MQVQRTLPRPEHVATFAADHLPYQLSAVAGLTHDLLDRYAVLRQSQDGRVGLLAAQIALILEALSGCEQLGIDGGRADDGAYLTHRFADGIEEGPTGVLHQMPPICDLYRVWQGLGRGFAISATTVTGDDCDRRMSGEPGLGRRRLTIRQQGDDPAPFQVADNAGVPVIAPPRPIVNANDLERVGWRAAAASHDAQERVFSP